MDKVLNKVPNMAPDGPLGTEKKGTYVKLLTEQHTQTT